MIQQSILSYSFDGYFRLTFNAFTRLNFIHKSAWEDTDLCRELRADNIPADRAGYCEWDTGGSRAVSIGWAWFAIDGGGMFVAPGGVNSNLMLITQKRYDIGVSKTTELLRAWLSSVSWQPQHISDLC